MCDLHGLRSNRMGYTLIELLVVIALLGIAGAILVPHLTDLKKLEVQAAVRTIVADMSFAQSDALANQEYRRIHYYPDGSGYCIFRVDEPDFAKVFDFSESALPADTPEYIIDPLAGTLDRYIVNFATDDRYKNVRIERAIIDGVVLVPNGTDITYDELGGTVSSPNVPGSGGLIIVSSEDEFYEITIAPFTGKISVTHMP